MTKWKLTLYITGRTIRSQTAMQKLQPILQQNLGEDFQLDVIDVLESPQLAEDRRILATPTLIKEFPVPMRRVIGDMSDEEQVLIGLDLQSTDAASKTQTG